MGPFPSAAPGPASIFAGRGPRRGGQEPPDRRSRPPGPASPRSNSPRGRRRPRAGCARLSRSAFPRAERRGHSTSGVGAAWAWSFLSAAAPAPADPELSARARPPRPAGLPAPASSGARSPGDSEEGDRGHPRPPPSPRAAAPPTCSVFSAAITTCSGSRAGPGSPSPPGGHLSPQRRAAAAAARTRAERDAPPCRRPASPLGGLHGRAAVLRRPGAPPPSAALLARSLARSPARPEPLQPPRAAFLPSAPSPSFAAAGAELGKPAPAAGERRELKQETRSQGGNPGGVERGEGELLGPVGLYWSFLPSCSFSSEPNPGVSDPSSPLPSFAPGGAS